MRGKTLLNMPSGHRSTIPWQYALRKSASSKCFQHAWNNSCWQCVWRVVIPLSIYEVGCWEHPSHYLGAKSPTWEKCNNMGGSWPTEGKNPTRWHAPDLGAERAYFVKFPKNKYSGQALAILKAARWVASEKNIRPAIICSSDQPGSLGCLWRSSWACNQDSEV
jgi:hypothetical protein